MELNQILMLPGGLALFLYGMQMMSSGLEAAAGNRMKSILERLTANRFMGVLAGAVITAVIQSSSATTVMVVGFVAAGLMTLNQAVWVIMGANIGTTITGQLIALDIGMIAPLIAFAGVVMIVFLKGEKQHHIGSIIAGLGVLFTGMDMMSAALEPLQESKTFMEIITRFNNPLVGILAGALFTAIIQSSSASVGILQALAESGIIGLPQAVYVLFGQNIGTCITAVLASIGTRVNAKRTTIIHLMFNIIGTIVFTVICMVTPFVSFMQGLAPDNPVAQIANVHTTFNVVTTLLLLPFGNLMAKAAIRILPDKEGEQEQTHRLEYLMPFDLRKTHQVGQVSVILEQLSQETGRMLQYVEKNVRAGFGAILDATCNTMERIEEREEYIDYLNAEISRYIANMLSLEMSAEDSKRIHAYFAIVGNLERIGDHAMNLADYAAQLSRQDLKLSKEAKEEVRKMSELSMETLEVIRCGAVSEEIRMLELTAKNEQKADDMSELFREHQLVRMKEGVCKAETGILYSEMITDFERIGDHALNIAEQYHHIM